MVYWGTLQIHGKSRLQLLALQFVEQFFALALQASGLVPETAVKIRTIFDRFSSSTRYYIYRYQTIVSLVLTVQYKIFSWDIRIYQISPTKMMQSEYLMAYS